MLFDTQQFHSHIRKVHPRELRLAERIFSAENIPLSKWPLVPNWYLR